MTTRNFPLTAAFFHVWAFATVPHKHPKASSECTGCASSDSGVRSFVVEKHVCVFYSAWRCVRSPDFNMLCGLALPEVEEQKNLTLGQQNRRAYPLDSRRSRDLLFPANDLTPTESHEGGSFLEVSQQMQIMAVISLGSKDETSVSGVRMKRGNVWEILHPHPPFIY